MTHDILSNLWMSAIFVGLAIFSLWLLSLRRQDASIIGKFWAIGFAVIAVVSLLAKLHMSGGNRFLWFMANDYMLLLVALPLFWALRYSFHVIKRSWGYGEDMRYSALRENVAEAGWPLYSFGTIFVTHGLVMLVVASPIWVGIGSSFFTTAPEFAPYTLPDGTWVRSASKMVAVPIGIFTVVGTLVWLAGFLFEAIGDWQLTRFKKRRNTLGADVTGMVLDKGLWGLTRHPNYFGNALMWWGLWLIACQTPWGWITIISPLLMTYILLRVTGVPVLENILGARPEYAAYMQRTSMFVPRIRKKQKVSAKGSGEEAFFANLDAAKSNPAEPNFVEPNFVEPNLAEPNLAEPNLVEPSPAIQNRPTPHIRRSRRRAEQFSGANYNTWP